MTSERHCPHCGQRNLTGAFCTECGRAAADRSCERCGATLGPEARFCSACGEALHASSGRRPGVGLAVAGGVLVLAMLGWAGWIYVAGADSSPGVAAADQAAVGAAAVDISSMSPRERADRLFDRVMRAMASGDSAEAQRFAPMALAAHQQVGALDADLRFHVATLGLLTGDVALAAVQADSILAETPDHLFGLHAAAKAALRQGDREAASRSFARLLAVYPEEAVRERPEYRMHAPLLPHMRRDAEAFQEAGSGGGESR